MVVGVPVQFRRSSNDDPLTLVAFHSAASAASSPPSFRDAAPVMVDVVVVVRVILLRVTLDPGTLRDAISGMGLVQQ